MNHYLKTKEEILREFGTDADSGLTSAKAEEMLGVHGTNKLVEGKKVPLIRRLLNQISDPMVLILIAAAVISAVVSIVNHESFADVFVILTVVVINTVLGVVQESKAEKAIEALKEMSAATSKVVRDGKISVMHSEELVPGDVVLLEAGDAVPADGRIIEAAQLKTEEAALTGESLPVTKTDSALAWMQN